MRPRNVGYSIVLAEAAVLLICGLLRDGGFLWTNDFAFLDLQTQDGAAEVSDADVDAGAYWSAVRSAVAKPGSCLVVGVAEALVLNAEAFVLMTLVRHRVKVRDLAFDKRVVAGLKRIECINALRENRGTRKEHPQDSERAREGYEEPMKTAPAEAPFCGGEYCSDDEEYEA